MGERKKDSIALISDKFKVFQEFKFKSCESSYKCDSSEDANGKSNDELRKIAENLALLTRTFNKMFGKKKFYSNFKSDDHKSNKDKLKGTSWNERLLRSKRKKRK